MIDDARPHTGLPAANAAMIEISMQPTEPTKKYPAAKILIVIYQLCSTILVEAYSVNNTCGFGTHSASMQNVNRRKSLDLTSIQANGKTSSDNWAKCLASPMFGVIMDTLHPILPNWRWWLSDERISHQLIP